MMFARRKTCVHCGRGATVGVSWFGILLILATIFLAGMVVGALLGLPSLGGSSA